MPTSATTLDQAVANAASQSERVGLLLELCEQYRDIDPKRLLEYAGRAESEAGEAGMRSETALALKYSGFALFLIGDYRTATLKLRAAHDLFEGENERSNLIEVLGLLARIDCLSGFPDRAREHLQEAELLCDPDVPGRDRIRLCEGWNVLYRNLGDMGGYLTSSQRMLAAAEALNDYKGIALACYHLGFIFNCFDQHETAAAHHERALDLCRRHGYAATEINVMEAVIERNLKSGEPEAARDNAVYLAELAERLGRDAPLLNAQRLLAFTFLQLGDHRNAISCARRMTDLAERLDSLPDRALACFVRADVYMAGGRLENARVWYERGLIVADKAGLREHGDCVSAHRNLAELHERRGDLMSAYLHCREHERLHRQLLNFVDRKAAINAAMEGQVSEARLEHERIRARMNALESQLESTQRNIQSAAIVSDRRNELLAELRTELRNALSMPADESRGSILSIIARLGLEVDGRAAWMEFIRMFEAMNPEFIPALTGRFEGLTPAELKVCVLLRFHLGSKDIASLLGVRASSVDICRSAIRRKLGLPRGRNLTAFLSSL